VINQRRTPRALILLLLLALLTAACGGGGDSGSDDATGGGDSNIDEGEPVDGGRLVVGLEADSDGFNPTANRFAVSGHSVALAIFDPLMMTNADGEVVPYLAQSLEPDDDHTVWTLTLREGVQFHDGTALDSAAVVRNIQAHLDSALTGPALSQVASVEATDPLTVTITMENPWLPFPAYLTGQLGYVAAPSMLDDPEGSRAPVGTGPFVVEEWIPGQRFRATKNPSYWRADEGLPHLDEIEFRPIIEAQSRLSAVQSGEVDVMHTTDSATIVAMQDADLQVLELDEGATEESFILLNTARPPFDNENARLALAHATDRQRYVEVIQRGVNEIANGPFSGQDEYAEPDFPEYDPDRARALLEAYEEETGEPLRFQYSTTNSAVNLQAAQLFQDMWAEVGIEAGITQVEQSSLISNAITGEFQATGWRQHGEEDPDQAFVWWDINNANDLGTLSLNFGRYRNEELQQILQDARENPDEESRREAYGQVAQIFADDVPFLYLSRTLWAYGAKRDVAGLTGGTPMPDDAGQTGTPAAGTFRAVDLYRTQ
jgi:peptide/nickel transport system substrate-binding protein